MDVDARRFGVCIVGFSMAAFGFFLSILAPVVTTFLPHLQTPMPVQHSLEHRKSSPSRRRSKLPVDTTASPVESADSVATGATNATLSVSSTSHAEASRRFHGEQSPRRLATPSLQRGVSVPSPRGSGNRMRHMCSPEHCTKHASTSASASSSCERVSSNDMNARPLSLDATSSAPASFTFTPRSSSELGVHYPHPVPLSPPHEHRLDEQQERNRDADRRPRALQRASTFFGFRRSSSKRPTTPTRSGSESSFLPLTPPSARRSLTYSPPQALTPLSDLDAEDFAPEGSESPTGRREKLRKPSYFSRLKVKGKEKAREVFSEKPKNRDSEPARNLSESEHYAQQQQRNSESGERRTSRRRSLCLRPLSQSRSSSRAETVPVTAPRTRPYEAPYNFPTPESPEARDYVRRTRDGYVRSAPPHGAEFAREAGGMPVQEQQRQQRPRRAASVAGADELGFALGYGHGEHGYVPQAQAPALSRPGFKRMGTT
ncbi:hypothetical protein DFH11DRAFT_551978 [Phellopilus nigrolimitatus]|nr:hypothetical protein DFH11DRAFT_551978 [Phellopilus nigrolimitatus]